MSRAAGMFGIVSVVLPFVFAYFISDPVGLWFSILAGFAVLIVSFEALARERIASEQRIGGARARGQLCPVVVRTDGYRLRGRQ